MLNEMTAEETAMLESEIQALNGGHNEPYNDNNSQNDDYTENETEDYQNDDYTENETEDYQDDEEIENKTEKKIKKLLHQRNEEKREKNSLIDRISQLENKLADTEFYKDNQNALEYKEQINQLVNDRGFTREEAYLLLAGKNILEQSKQNNSNKTSMIGNTPGNNKNGVNPKNMSMNDLDSLVKNMYSAGKINI